MSQPPLLFRYRDLSWIPLFELLKVISYAFILAIRQFEAKQFIPATVGLALLELTYGQLGQAQLLSQMMQAWKDPHRTSFGQLIEGCTLEYIVWRRQKIKDAVPFLARL